MGTCVLRFDGLFEPRYTSYGFATYGFIVEHEGKLVHEGKGVVAPPGAGASANVAEFGALILGLLWVRKSAFAQCPLRIEGDSRLVVETVKGTWRLTSERLLPYREIARELLGGLNVDSIVKIPRAANAEPDRLTREAYREALQDNPEWKVWGSRPLGRPSRA